MKGLLRSRKVSAHSAGRIVVSSIFTISCCVALLHVRYASPRNLRAECPAGSKFFDGECIPGEHKYRVRHDPCSPPGRRVHWGAFAPGGPSRTADRLSRLSGSLERHRFLCTVLPSIVLRLGWDTEAATCGGSSKLYCYPGMEQIHPIRVLAFGNEGEEAIANIISSSFKNKIVDHVLADPGVQNDIRGKGGFIVDAQNIAFPTVTYRLTPGPFPRYFSSFLTPFFRSHPHFL
jgi:hypothetical protein